MYVGAAFVADGKAAEAGEPGEGPLDHPAMASELLATFDAASGNAGRDRAGPAFPTATLVIVAFVGVQLDRATTRSTAPAPYTGNGVQGRGQHHAVVSVGTRQRHAERRAIPVDHKMALRARFAAIRRVRADLRSPLLAATLALSSEQRLQSRCSASASRSRSTRCSRSQTPTACQSRNRRQHVMPEQPISAGSISHGTPDRRTNTIPPSTARSSRRGRPPFGRDGSGGNRGSIDAHNSSQTRSFPILRQRARRGFVRRSRTHQSPASFGSAGLCWCVRCVGSGFEKRAWVRL